MISGPITNQILAMTHPLDDDTKPFPHRMIRITLYSTRISDLRRQIEDMKRLDFHSRGNMEIDTSTSGHHTTAKGFHYAYIQHMTRKP